MNKARAAARHGIVSLRNDGTAEVRYERHFDHTVDRVWRAITKPDDLFAFFEDVDLREGGQLSIRYGNHTETYTITALEAPRLIEYQNIEREPGREDYLTRIELRPAGDGCLMVFQTRLGPDSPAQLRILVGWHVWIDGWQAMLDGTASREALDANWDERERRVADDYVKSLRTLYPDWRYDR